MSDQHEIMAGNGPDLVPSQEVALVQDGTDPTNPYADDFSEMSSAAYREMFNGVDDPLALLRDHMGEIRKRFSITRQMIEVAQGADSVVTQQFHADVTAYYGAEQRAAVRAAQKRAIIDILRPPEAAAKLAVAQIERERETEEDFGRFYNSGSNNSLVKYGGSDEVIQGEQRQYGTGKERITLSESDMLEVEFDRLRTIVRDLTEGNIPKRKVGAALAAGVTSAFNSFRRLRQLDTSIARSDALRYPIERLRASITEFSTVLGQNVANVHDLSPELFDIVQGFHVNDLMPNGVHQAPHTQELEDQPRYYIPIVDAGFPGVRPDVIEAFALPGTKAMILESNGKAALSTTLHPTIRRISDQGTTVFVLAENDTVSHGITEIVDEPQVGTLAAGAFYLETLGREIVNNPESARFESLKAVVEAIEAGIDEGLTGPALGEYVQGRFSFPAGKKPVRDVSVEALRRHEARLIAEGLGGIGLHDAEGNFVGFIEDETEEK